MAIPDLVPSSIYSSDNPSSSLDKTRDSGRFITNSPSLRRLITRAELVAPHLRLATIEGEPGAGKQTMASLLYRRVANVHPGLVRSGFSRCDAREWLLDAGDPRSMSGFTYLERVDLLAAPAQMLLLRILKELESRPCGSVFVVAASESSLRDLAAKGRFLSDLAFRLTAVHFALPPLRERREDIVPLSTVILDRIRLRYRVPAFSLAPGSVARLLQHDWPGNVRELSSVLECAVLECTDSVVREEDLCISSSAAPMNKVAAPTQVLSLHTVIQNHLLHVLELNRGNKLKTARQLGISRSTLYRMLETRDSLEN